MQETARCDWRCRPDSRAEPFNSHWLVPVGAAALVLGLGRQCSCFLLLKFLLAQDWAFEAEFHQTLGQLPALQDRGTREGPVKERGRSLQGRQGSTRRKSGERGSGVFAD